MSELGYFLLGDSLNTTVTVIGTLQNSIVAYNTLQLTYLLIVGIAAQVNSSTSIYMARIPLINNRPPVFMVFGLSSADIILALKPCSMSLRSL